MPKTAPKKSPVWNPPPLDWRKFDDPCRQKSRKAGRRKISLS